MYLVLSQVSTLLSAGHAYRQIYWQNVVTQNTLWRIYRCSLVIVGAVLAFEMV